MTPQEAIELVEQCGLNIEGIKNIECENLIVSALEKQIPKKPYKPFATLNNIFACICNHAVSKGDKYCTICGQALDWSDTE